MEKLLVLLAAIAMIVLGARGTYKAVWNQFFPNEQIVTTPVSTTGTPQATAVPAPSGSPGNPKGASPITQTPNVTQTGGSNAGQKVTVVKGGGGVYPVKSVSATGGGAPIYISASNAPSWWPSWLPYPGDNQLSGW